MGKYWEFWHFAMLQSAVERVDFGKVIGDFCIGELDNEKVLPEVNALSS